ncbi:acetate/propionate family kinase [Sphingomonas sp. PAMC 26605]|uniref:acetate/propionate family kinase n=1 Tax=Sphingomonas sp. PAMC 26605 TaxID=1112214 RepID=UPI00026CAC79|nr:acetate/propionate family kinase [Sphingomonas sp. PAMC 26605]
MSASRVPAGTTILTFNGGSSSLKFGLFDVAGALAEPLLTGEIETAGGGAVRLHAADPAGRVRVDHSLGTAAPDSWTRHVVDLLDRTALPAPAVIGHRLVHGGPELLAPVRIDAAVLGQIQAAARFAPLHIPTALATIRATQQHFPNCPQVACFDTGFHATMPAVASTLPLPAALRAQGLRRYGFHGLSCESIVRQLGHDVPERLIIAHLGNGASVTAVRAGRSVDTSMGLTPTGGLIMGRRTGDLDPGVLLHLLRSCGYTPETLATLVDRESGLLGVSGIDSDLRRLNAAAATQPAAALAIAMFCHALVKTIAAMAGSLGGVDMIVFTGGIGEHDPGVRATACAALGWMGVALDPTRNRAGAATISGDASRVAVRVLPAREDREIALHSAAVVGAG